ncbi:alkaline phosphatase [Bacillus mesophilus]|uniref:Alkaline phosphatase n=1 Tax=Bacillus mesophilus TaxID=1808955 RepID=A0A6M0Q3P6_9BACI|nr:alkaline phosphatase [Bacillus mesophilus]MBM7659962.1 alkaline phosphatase [Bacillus mesophilus]NEY70824.1 alkaline phosphatase [Bacillus mesophilus]
MKKCVLVFFLIGSLVHIPPQPLVKAENLPSVKNVILLIGDGMGIHYTSSYRYLKDSSQTTEVEKTVFDPYLVGQQMTYPNDPDENITNSAAAGTALATGIKTYNNAISVDHNGKYLQTVLEAAKELGMATGIVATAEITHATPAAFGAHNKHRENMIDIADDYFDEEIKGKHKIDVILGGGRKYFEREDRNLVEEFKNDGFSYVKNTKELTTDQNEQIIGLFAKEGLPKMFDRNATIPSLEIMTSSAIERLNKNDQGFFLMVEGSQIDWAGHDQDIVSAMSEIEDFEKAFKAAIEFGKKDQHTLVIATADHSTGGYTMGANGIYNWHPSSIKAAKRTPDFIAESIASGTDVEKALRSYIKMPLTQDEIHSVKMAAETHDIKLIDDSIEEIFNLRTNTGWTTEGHTGVDVPVYAYGPSSEKLRGQINNTDIASLIFEVLKN